VVSEVAKTIRSSVYPQKYKVGCCVKSPIAAMPSLPQNSLRTQRFSLKGMSCAGCARRVERAISTGAPIASVSVNFATQTATVTYGESICPQAVIKAVEDAGYLASLEQTEEILCVDEPTETRSLRRNAIIAMGLAAPIFLLDMGGHLVPAFHHAVQHYLGTTALHALFFVLASLSQFGPGRLFYQKGWNALQRSAPDMNSLVMIGTSSAYAYSVVAVFMPGFLPHGSVHVYFEASAMIIALVLTGRWREAHARGKTGHAIRRLMELRPASARVLREGIACELPLSHVQVGDLVVVLPGQCVPVDGEVVEGESYVNEAMITGEPVPVHKHAGLSVVGGTVNTTGSLVVRAEHLGTESVLSRIIELVKDAQTSRLPIQALADKVTAVFVPIVLGLAMLTFLAWMIWGPGLSFAVVNAVAVLIIACPCAMGLATPTSILVATGRAAELGILFRRGDALQSLRNAQIVAFDKTGTLTEGHPRLLEIRCVEGIHEREALLLAASAEQTSEHPVARALVLAAKERGLTLPIPSHFDAVPGYGIHAQIGAQHVLIGSHRLLAREGIESACLPSWSDAASAGFSVLHMAIDGQHLVDFVVSDPLRETTPPAVQALRQAGLEVVMITGDKRATATHLATSLGILRIFADIPPEGKVAAVRELQEQGSVVFVGDGLNDAPALATADVGIAIGGGTDIAIEAADVVLMSPDPGKVHTALLLSRATIRNIQQNLFWAFAYNTLLIPLAAGALYPAFGILLSPIWAAAAMAASSLCVLANALRLRHFRHDAS